MVNYISSRPERRPLLLAKVSVSIPIRCIMLTNRLQSGSIIVAPEGNMLAMLEASAGEQNWQVRIVVNVRITHAAAVEHHGAVKQPLAILFLACQPR